MKYLENLLKSGTPRFDNDKTSIMRIGGDGRELGQRRLLHDLDHPIYLVKLLTNQNTDAI